MKHRATLIAILFAFPILVFAQTSTFIRSLRLGMFGEDVRTLQVLLNKDKETRIAESGSGSPGNETDYFGPATKRAVVKFQEKYREEVLTPLGLYFGTGFLGQKTSMKVSALFQQRTETSVAQGIVSPKEKTASTSITASLGEQGEQDTFPRIEKKYFNVTEGGLASLAEYYSNYANITKDVSFSQSELDSMMKKNEISDDKGKRSDKILLLEELIEVAKNGDNSKGVQASFKAWASLDNRMVAELKKLPITSPVFDANQELTSWFQYHGSVAERFGSGALTPIAMDGLSKEFSRYAATHISLYGKNIAKAQKKDPAFFTFINEAEASGCGLTQFGGRIAAYFTCNFGTVHAVVGTCGGAVLFTWPVQAANPFLWHNIYTPGVAVLGKSIINPAGFCPLGFPPFMVPIPSTDIAIFYGTGLAI